MNFKNYCIIGLVSKKSLIEDIERMSEYEPNVFNPNSGALLIATFTSAQNSKELTDYFLNKNKNFFLFELNDETSGFAIDNDDIYTGLFGFLKDLDMKVLNERAKDMVQEIQFDDVTTSAATANTKTRFQTNSIIKGLSDKDIAKMNSDQKNDLMNEIIGKGVNKLTKSDKELLVKLSK